MATIVAREGRHRQRYQGNYRLVSGCIPYRIKMGVDDGGCIEVLMISSPNRNDLVFPKGGWDDDETVHEAACREALEEAGVRGILNKCELGVWEFRSKSSLEGGCKGYMFALEVTEELDTWPEQKNHPRKWFSIAEAERLCRYEWLREALKKFVELIETDKNVKNSQKEVRDPLSIMTECHVVKPSSINCSRITMLLSLH